MGRNGLQNQKRKVGREPGGVEEAVGAVTEESDHNGSRQTQLFQLVRGTDKGAKS